MRTCATSASAHVSYADASRRAASGSPEGLCTTYRCGGAKSADAASPMGEESEPSRAQASVIIHRSGAFQPSELASGLLDGGMCRSRRLMRLGSFGLGTVQQLARLDGSMHRVVVPTLCVVGGTGEVEHLLPEPTQVGSRLRVLLRSGFLRRRLLRDGGLFLPGRSLRNRGRDGIVEVGHRAEPGIAQRFYEPPRPHGRAELGVGGCRLEGRRHVIAHGCWKVRGDERADEVAALLREPAYVAFVAGHHRPK